VTETVAATLPLRQWQGERGVYHFVNFGGEEAEALAGHALMHRLEYGRQRGFGSIKVTAVIGETSWKTSVFPMKLDEMSKRSDAWTLLVSKKVMRAEDIAPGDEIEVSVTPL
jgi:xylose isomerase